jgi:hypothetical protein
MARIEEKHNSHSVLVVKMGKETSWKKQKYEDNIKVGIKEVGWEGVDNSSGSHREKCLL